MDDEERKRLKQFEIGSKVKEDHEIILVNMQNEGMVLS
jgi:hypothetical protein